MAQPNLVPFRPRADRRRLPYNLGRYTLFDHIGRGGMADIYLARAKAGLGSSRLMVVKEVIPSLAENRRYSKMLTAEAKMAARLTHPNITGVHDLGREDGVLYIAMDYVEGLDLGQLLRSCSKRRVPLPMGYRLSVVIEVLRALQYAHNATDSDGSKLGVIHRDVSPSNVLLSFDGEVKICDFGIALAADHDQFARRTIEGKAGYMSPEHARGDAVDHRSDIYAAGILLWELLAGRRMYRASGDLTLVDVARRGEIPALVVRGLPDEARLHAVVRQALRRDATERYQSAGEMLRELETYCLDHRLLVTSIRFGEWLTENFEEERVACRRSRERALAALDRGPAVSMQPLLATPNELLARAQESGAKSSTSQGMPNALLESWHLLPAVSLQAVAAANAGQSLKPLAAPLVPPPLPARAKEVDLAPQASTLRKVAQPSTVEVSSTSLSTGPRHSPWLAPPTSDASESRWKLAVALLVGTAMLTYAVLEWFMRGG